MVEYIGYHGTTEEEVSLLRESGGFLRSPRDGLWLGTGAYFFQDGYEHALSWAENRAQDRGGIPAVIEARINADIVVDFSDRLHWSRVRQSYDLLLGDRSLREQFGPEGLFDETIRKSPSFGHNFADHDVVNHFVAVSNELLSGAGRQIDLIRCPFPGGRQVFPTSWFFGRSCIMISVVNLESISSWSVVTPL